MISRIENGGRFVADFEVVVIADVLEVSVDWLLGKALHEIENHPEKYGSFETRICRQTLYAYIDKGVFLRLTNKALPFKGSRRKKKTKHVQRAKQQPKGESIEKRPPEIDGRQEFGHWEMDLVVSCRGGHKCLLVLTERVTRMEVIPLSHALLAPPSPML